MELKDVFAARYSVRAYAAKAVEEEKISAILEGARLAPTAKDLQPFRIRVVREGEMEKLATATKCTFGAPLAFILGAAGECYQRGYDGKLSYDVDLGIVETYMMLTAVNAGLGTCWVMAFDPAKVKAAFPEFDLVTPVTILICGYAAENAKPAERHFQRKPIGEILL